MIYFILWVVFLLTVLLAVPVAAFVEKRRLQAANPTVPTDPDAEAEAWSDDDPGEADPFADAQPVPNGAEEAVEFGEVEGDDEFAEFDEIS
jgi:hypothetical protein